MSAPPVVILLVALGGAREPSTRAMAAATQDALEPNALVLVREVPSATLASDDRAIALADAVHADAVAVLTWPDTEHRRAHVHVFAAKPARWIDRDIDFHTVDAAEERGKALGFAVATMVPSRADRAPREKDGASAPRVARSTPDESAIAPPPPPPRMAEPAPPAREAPRDRDTPAERPREVPRERRGAFDLVAIASSGVGGYANGFGSEASARWQLPRPFAVRIGGGLRIGDIAPARASSYVARFDAGIAWTPLVTGGAHPFALGVRADAAVLFQTVSRPTTSDTTSRGSRWLPAGDALLETGWTFVPEAALVAAGGVEVAEGATTVLVDGTPTAKIPSARIIGEFGVRVLF